MTLPSVLGIKTAAIAGAASLLIGLTAGAYAGYRWEFGRYNALVASNAKAMTIAVQRAAKKQRKIDLANQEDAVAEAYFRGKADATTITLKMEAPANVTVLQDSQAAAADHAGCITYGFVRLLVAGERLVAPDSLPLPDGATVDACTAYEPSALAAAISQDLADGQRNTHQLDALIGAVKRNDDIVEAKP